MDFFLESIWKKLVTYSDNDINILNVILVEIVPEEIGFELTLKEIVLNSILEGTEVSDTSPVKGFLFLLFELFIGYLGKISIVSEV